MDEAKEKGNRQALAIENAETEILRLSKDAVMQLWSLEKYRKKVEEVIEKAKKEAPSISDRCEKPLKDYATKMLARQKTLLSYQAAFFAFLIREGRSTERVEKLIGKPVLESRGFIKAADQQFFEPSGDWETGMPRHEYMKTYMKDVKSMVEQLVAENAQEAYDSNVSLRNIAEMTVRYDGQIDMIDRLRKNGVRLVWIVPHANCSKRCEPYQGHLYSLDGTQGTIDGIQFRPLEYATDNPRDRYVTKKGVVYQNGCITGFNCRHRLEEYRSGSKPSHIPKSVVEKQRAVNDKQRSYEREIRYLKKLSVQMKGTPEGKAAREKARKTTEKYIKFCEKNSVAYYPDRINII